MTAEHARDWWRRARHSLRVRLVLLFLLLAVALSAVFLSGFGRAFSVGWRDAVNPLIGDYADRLVSDIGSPPSIERARAIAERLPVVVRITGPSVNWQSGTFPHRGARWARDEGQDRATVVRSTVDGHRIELTLSARPEHGESRRAMWLTLAALLALTALAYGLVHRLLRPIREIGEGARRFGAGQFEQPIPVRKARHPDELSQLADTVNQMAGDIRQMLDAKRALLLAISHELRSPLTRARLNAELLPDDAAAEPMRAALLRDLGVMRDLIADLLESERLSSSHAALQREPVDLVALAREVIDGLNSAHPAAGQVDLKASSPLATARLDAVRMRLLLRNLLDNALRHSPAQGPPPDVQLRTDGRRIHIEVRDHGPGVTAEQLRHLAEPFYRTDDARQRSTGGVGLGLYLCRLVVQAHGGEFELRNAHPGLAIRVTLPV